MKRISRIENLAKTPEAKELLQKSNLISPRALYPGSLVVREITGAILLDLSLKKLEMEINGLAQLLQTPSGIKSIHEATGGYLI